MSKYTIGIDIGGTNTDLVLVDQQEKILTALKVPTTYPVELCFKDALTAFLKQKICTPDEIDAIMVGTTHATNAILQEKDLHTVGLIRIAGHKPSLPACFGMKASLRDQILNSAITINGGYECDGRETTKFSVNEATEAIDKLLENGVNAIAVAGVFAPLYKEQELLVGKIIEERAAKDFPYTLSHQVGGIGIIERENTAVLNSALIKALASGFVSLQEIKDSLMLKVPLYNTKNNGTLITLEQALKYPVLTIAAGPTNSFIGASKLAKQENAIIIDIGGTSSDCGIILNGFPRRSLNTSTIADIPLNFAMPDVISIGLGGGSIIEKKNTNQENAKTLFNIGPKSVANQLLTKAQSFGGTTLTLTDAAIKAQVTHKFAKFDNLKAVDLSINEAEDIIQQATEQLDHIANILASSVKNQQLPIILVGGGASLINQQYFSLNVMIPEHSDVANAYGAALAEISLTYDKIISLEQREQQLSMIKTELTTALSEKIEPGTSKVIEQIIIQFHYMPGHLARVIMTVAGKRHLAKS